MPQIKLCAEVEPAGSDRSCLTVLASLGLINLWIAVGVGDMGLSLAVIISAMRSTRIKA